MEHLSTGSLSAIGVLMGIVGGLLIFAPMLIANHRRARSIKEISAVNALVLLVAAQVFFIPFWVMGMTAALWLGIFVLAICGPKTGQEKQ